MSEPDGFTCGVNYEHPGPVCVLTLCGSLDADCVGRFEAIIEKELQSGANRFALDLGQLRYVGSLGLRTFVSLHKKLKAEGEGRMCVFDPSPAVQSVLDVVKLGQVFRVLPTREDALAAVRG